MPPFRPRPPSDRQPGIEQANNRQRSFGFNPRQQQRPGGFQPPQPPMERPAPMPRYPGTIGRPPMQGETGRSLGPAGGPVPPTGRSLRDIFKKSASTSKDVSKSINKGTNKVLRKMVSNHKKKNKIQ